MNYSTYGNYSNHIFMEKISENLLDDTLNQQNFSSTQEAVEYYINYRDSWQQELDKTIIAIKKLKDDVTLDNYDDIVVMADALDAYYVRWKEYIDMQLDLESEFYRNYYSDQKQLIPFTNACEIRKFTLKLKEYYYNITGKVEFYYDDNKKSS